MTDHPPVPVPDHAVTAARRAVRHALAETGLIVYEQADRAADQAVEAAAPAIREAERQRLAAEVRELLAEAEQALTRMWKAALTVETTLRQPYPDAPETTPWAR